MTSVPHAASVLHVASGPRAAESLLLRRVLALADGITRDPGALRLPIRVVVPSRSLREHVCARLVEARGGGLAGIQVQTLAALAREVVARAGGGTPLADPVLDVLIREHALREPALAGDLARFDSGPGAALGAVRDLLDAGLDARGHADALENALEEAGGGRAVARARGLVRVALAVHEECEACGLETRASLLRRARQALERAGPGLLPRRALFVHGFADATGVASDLLAALCAGPGATVVLDQPPDPARPEQRDRGAAFTARLQARLASRCRVETAPAGPGVASDIELLEAPGSDGEVRAVAERVRARLDAGLAPERIGVVARQLEPFAAAIARQFERLAIPFSAPGGRLGLDGVGRRLRALEELVTEGPRASVDRWLDAVAPVALEAPAARLRLGLHTLGAARLATLAGLDVAGRCGDGDGVPLPFRTGLRERDDAGERSVRARRERVSRAAMEATVAAGARAAARLAAWPETAPLHRHADELERLAAGDLAWSREPDMHARLQALLAALGADRLGARPVRRTTFLAQVRRLASDAGGLRGRAALGGAGAGVQVLDAIAARGRTFEALFVIGLERERFPRIVLEDALLPDGLRRALGTVLPELPCKLGGFDEERYLFAQLLASSPEATLSWQYVGDDGRPRSASSFVERLRAGEQPRPIGRQPGPLSRAGAAARPAYEHALRAALAGRRAFPDVLALALDEAGLWLHPGVASDASTPGPDPARVASGLVAVLRALDPPWREAGRLGPYDGLVGAPRLARDPRRAALAITTLEQIARCPWQAFLRRCLRLEPRPDALEALPVLDALRLGSVVHRTVEALVEAAGGAVRLPLSDALARPPVEVRWPGREEVRRRAERAAHELLQEDGLDLPGLAGAFAERALPLLETLRQHVFAPDGVARLLAAEAEGRVSLATASGGQAEVHFRADLVQAEDGTPLLTDLKTGRGLREASQERTIQRRLLEKISQGLWLQANAYARGAEGRGRYLFLDPDRAGARVVVEPDGSDPAVAEAFGQATGWVLEALARGAFVPRLVEPGRDETPDACGYCEVKVACNQGDTGARHRVRDALSGDASGPLASGDAGSDGEAPEASGEALSAARAVFGLGRGPA